MTDTPTEKWTAGFTAFFDYDVRKFKGNPLLADTPFGQPETVAIGNAFHQRDGLEEINNDLADSLANLISVIDAAGLDNLSNGVQLGQTVWFVKASDAITYAKNSLAKARGEQP